MTTKSNLVDEERVSNLVAEVGVTFSTFGGGIDDGAAFNPLIGALKDRPLVFALGVDVREVVKFILERSR